MAIGGRKVQRLACVRDSLERSWSILAVLVCGCMASQEGSESAARNYFDSEIKKWMAGETNTVSTMQSRNQPLQEPIRYDIRSVVTGDPDFLACQDAANLPKDWETWPAFKLNVAIEWKSRASSPLTQITSYTLTWNTSENLKIAT